MAAEEAVEEATEVATLLFEAVLILPGVELLPMPEVLLDEAEAEANRDEGVASEPEGVKLVCG